MGSFINLVDLVSADNINFHHRRSNDHDSSAFSPEGRHQKMIIVANYLPLNSEKDDITGRWCFSYDEDSIFRQLKDGLSSDIDFVYVGSLKVDVDKSEQENVSQLLEEFNCFPTFIPARTICRLYFIACFLCIRVPAMASMSHFGRLMFLLTRYLPIKLWKFLT